MKLPFRATLVVLLTASSACLALLCVANLRSDGRASSGNRPPGPFAASPDDQPLAGGWAFAQADQAGVRRAAHTVPALLPLIVGAESGPTITAIKINDTELGELSWPVGPDVPRLTSRTMAIEFTRGDLADADTIGIQEVGKAPAEQPVGGGTGPTDTLSIGFTLEEATTATRKLKLYVKKNDVETRSTEFSVYVPPSSPPATPEPTRGYNNPLAKSAEHAIEISKPGKDQISVFGSYLRLSGNHSTAQQELRFALFHKVEDKENSFAWMTDITPANPRVPASGKWDMTLNLPVPLKLGFSGRLLGYAVRPGDSAHKFATVPVVFTVKEDRVSVNPPTIVVSRHDAAAGDFKVVDAATGTQTYIVNSKKFELSGTAQLQSGDAVKSSRIVLYEIVNGIRTARLTNDEGIELTPGKPDTGPATWKTTIENLPDGDRQYEATIVQGSLESQPSTRITVRTRTTGPTVRDFDPQNRLFGAGRINLTFYFDRDHPLKEESAENVNNYSITGPSVENDVEEALSATYRAEDNSVAVSFKDYADDGRFVVTVRKTPLGTAAPAKVASDGKPADDPKPSNPPAAAKSSPSDALSDIYGNGLEKDFTVPISRSRAADLPSVAPGISHTTGPFVEYREFTNPRDPSNGFNPDDKVETRVARLYFFRDAHRVAQIVNRTVRSYNRQGVDMRRQLADKARGAADELTLQRQKAQRDAIQAASRTRQAENQLNTLQQSLNQVVREMQFAATNGTPPETVQAMRQNADALAQRINQTQASIQPLRGEEARLNDAAQQLEGREQLARLDQFRRETAAAHEDPDTYGPGKPDSNDPVRQVSISVIGEGLIHLRGPIKGINVIRTMIDQIDSPLGQVRVGVHTVQINGERADRMEDVANVIQRYIDQARFLTLQSGEMLRRSVVQVAARKAELARAQYPGESQEARDQRYLHSFFGKDFIEELRAMDSEFLRTGNKLLSLHSMDTTSLSSALTLLALAKNSTRHEILTQFDELLRTELPRAEASNLEAGALPCKKNCDLRHPPKVYHLAQNAKFESLRAFFNSELGHEDTMTPLQREFVRLAQILKSRLITELEYKQRVVERGLIEERLGDRLDELRKAKNKELAAQAALEESRKSLRREQAHIIKQIATVNAVASIIERRTTQIVTQTNQLRSAIGQAKLAAANRLIRLYREDYVLQSRRAVERQQASSVDELLATFDRAAETARQQLVQPGSSFGEQIVKFDTVVRGAVNELRKLDPFEQRKEYPIAMRVAGFDFKFKIDANGQYLGATQGGADMKRFLTNLKSRISKSISELESNHALPQRLQLDLERAKELVAAADLDANDDYLKHIQSLTEALSLIAETSRAVFESVTRIRDQIRELGNRVGEDRGEISEMLGLWYQVRDHATQFTRGELRTKTIDPLIASTDEVFDRLLETSVEVRIATQSAAESRRPLDHKKLLDALIGDIEEKYIELMEGTRAHTANIDNYLKRLTTALDDDFNTQFYHPTFRYVREASTYWDVQFGQTETTNILANNRMFAKVEPSATIEFDLPPRDILLSEAIDGAKAMIDDVGALANDPTFLAAARMKAPNSTAASGAGSNNGQPVMRSVLPGLQSQTNEQILAQNQGSARQFGANLENLIPDPAIYKFETGTGFEIRPVIQPDGQAVVFDFHYLYTTNVREPVRADEKHLGRVKQHLIDTDVQLSNFELREVSRYQVALKASRTARGVPLFEDVPVVGVLFRPLPSDESSLQQNLIMAQATIFPTLFDLMGLRWAPVVAELDPLQLSNREFIVKGRRWHIKNRVFDETSSQVDEFLRIPQSLRRRDLYRSQETIPRMHPNGYNGPGMDFRDSTLQEGYQPNRTRPQSQFVPQQSNEGAPYLPGRGRGVPDGMRVAPYPLENVRPPQADPQPLIDPREPRNNLRPPRRPPAQPQNEFPLNPAYDPAPPAPPAHHDTRRLPSRSQLESPPQRRVAQARLQPVLMQPPPTREHQSSNALRPAQPTAATRTTRRAAVKFRDPTPYRR